MNDWMEWLFLFLACFGAGGAAFVRSQLEHNRKNKLALAAEKRKTAEAEAAKLREQNISKALEVRQNELTLEQFDRQHGDGQRALTSSTVEDDNQQQIRNLIKEGTDRVRDREPEQG